VLFLEAGHTAKGEIENLKGINMSWRKKLTDNITDLLRFGAYLFLAFDAIVLSAFLFWFLTRFIWQFAQYINHHMFKNPWF
jgi:hypothetical protein